jgi:hypothetical protein
METENKGITIDLYNALDRLIREHGMSYPLRRDALKNARETLDRARNELDT